MNTWYPDVDNAATAILAQVKSDAAAVEPDSVLKAATWILGMQNRDGGWAAFDVDNDKLFLNKIPSSDMDSLCDTSCADITSRILEAFGLMMKLTPKSSKGSMKLHSELHHGCERGIAYLSSVQEPNGSWFGRWGCNYTYGTSHALCGLAYFIEDGPRVGMMVQPALSWLKSEQNADGGWGKSLLSYQHPGKKQNSTASQTAWALMGLLAYLPHTDDAVRRGVQYLVSSQAFEKNIGSSWPESVYTGTGFPNHFYIGYDYYRHYFPMMAFGRYLQAVRCQK